MHKSGFLLLLIFLFLSIYSSVFSLVSYASAYAQELPIVKSIEIKGLKRIEESAIKPKITQRLGEPISLDKVNEDIKNIFKKGYFDDLRAEIEPFEGGIRLIYIVKEKPTIVRIEFQGNEEFDDSKLRERLTITTGAIADAVLIGDNARRLRTFYEEKGYWLSSIVPAIERINADEVSLTYHIEEGSKVKIKKINIEGNKAISTSRIKRMMDTKERGLLSFITSTGYYKQGRMESDIEKIRNLYFNNGFIKVAVGEPAIQLTDDKKGMMITIPISEGDQFEISSIEFSGNKVFTDDVMKKRMTLTPGTPFSKENLRKDLLSISELYSEKGYPIITITPDLIPDEDKKLVKVLLRIDEGDRYRIGRIEILGNTKTRDKVIRREMGLDEGDVFNSALLKRSYERLHNLNFFEAIELVPKPHLEEKLLDIDIKVKERPTGFLSVGGGYSSIDGFVTMVDLTEGNLFGRGQFLKVRGELGGRSTLYEISFREPWFLDKPISLSTSIYRTTRGYIGYEKRATGFGVSLGKGFLEYWRGAMAYGLESATIFDVAEDAPEIIRRQEGRRTTSSLTPSIVRDSRDSRLDPSRGSRNSLYLTYAGIGGTNYFIKSGVDSAWYFPLGSPTIMLRGRFGHATGIWGEELPLYERFYVGGIHTVRGLRPGEAGPKDEETGDKIGGTEKLVFNAEYIFSLIREVRLKGLVFFDAGNAYESFREFGSLRYTTGAGVRWISPVGPIRLEWGYNLDRRPGEGRSRLEFILGTFF